MTLPKFIGSRISVLHALAEEPVATLTENTVIPKWLKIFESNPTMLAMFAATQLRWVPTFVEGADDSERIYAGEITSLTFEGRGVVSEQVLVQALSVLVQACHVPFEGAFGKPLNIELANEKTRRAVIRYADDIFIEFKIGANNSITAQAQGMSSFDFPQQEVLRQIKEHGSRFMSSTGLVLNAKSFEEFRAKKSVLIRDELFEAIMTAVQNTVEQHSKEEGGSYFDAGIKDTALEAPLELPTDGSILSLCTNAITSFNTSNLKYNSTLHASAASVPSKTGATINCSPYLLGEMINVVYSVRDPVIQLTDFTV